MAKKPARRKFNLRKVRVASAVAIGALAAFDVVGGDLMGASTNGYRVTSIKAAWNISDLGAAIDDGQEFGIAHGDYSDTEIEEALEAAAAIDIGDQVEQEKANRKVRSLGFFTGAQVADGSLSYNEGRPVKTKLNWYIGIGDTIKMWVRNGSDTVYTTGATLDVIGEMWVTP